MGKDNVHFSPVHILFIIVTRRDLSKHAMARTCTFAIKKDIYYPSYERYEYNKNSPIYFFF